MGEESVNDVEGDSELDLTAAYDESMETPKKEPANELMRGMYGKPTENLGEAPLDDIMVIDVVGNRQPEDHPVEKTPIRSLVGSSLSLLNSFWYAFLDYFVESRSKVFSPI